MGIDNPDVKLVIQWDIFISFDSMIQWIERTGKKGALSIFILFLPKWTKIDTNSNKIKQRLALKNPSISTKAANSSQLSNSKALAKPSPLNQVFNTNKDVSDLKSVAKSVEDSETAFNLDDADDDIALARLLATKDKENQIERKKKSKACHTNAKKRAKLPDKIFNYIHATLCQRLFSLEWYDDCTYAINHDGLIKLLLTSCCNGHDCRCLEPDLMQQAPFIETSSATPNTAEQEWIACQHTALKAWRKEVATNE